MAEGYNKVILIGNLGNDPELRTTAKGHPLLRCRLATNERYVDKAGERQERTEWHTVIVWGKRAEGLKRILHRGERIGIEGRIRTRKWEDPSGHDRWTTEVEATQVLLLGAGGAQEVPGASQEGRRSQEARPPGPAEDPIPF